MSDTVYISGDVLVSIDEPDPLLITIAAPSDELVVSIDDVELVYKQCDHEIYDGSYVVDPAFESIILETQNKVMTEDVEVNPIEVSRVSNLSGGTTVYIGGIINA